MMISLSLSLSLSLLDAYRWYTLSSQPPKEPYVLCYPSRSSNICVKLFIFLSLLHVQWMTLLFFALLVGIIFFKLDDKEYNPQTVISDRYCGRMIVYI